ncbi:MAG: homoserine dehydrogenase [Peptoniphilus sp. oral taxon 375]|nr:homoserine dehydrogenase [Peptoniphilus sp. oral taxon 375]
MKIAILGFGTVGRGTYDILQARRETLEDLGGIQVAKVLVLPKEVDRCGLDKDLVTTDYQEILDNEEISCIVEVTGAKAQGFAFMKEALERKKHVVTANKAVVSLHLEELTSLAKKNGVHFLYEAAVGGGIPVISPLKAQAKLNKIDSIEGIFNGTCNYILTNMLTKGWSYQETLKKAQDLGFAEADPTDDVEGLDTMRKLVIVSSLALGFPVLEDQVALEGISKIQVRDINYFKKKGLKVKLLASFKRQEEAYSLLVEPALMDLNHPLYGVDREINALGLHGDFVGQLTFIGPGAGKYPTGNAIVCDLMEIANSKERAFAFGQAQGTSQNNIRASYYVSLDSGYDLPEDWVLERLDLEEGQGILTKEVFRQDLVEKIGDLREAGAGVFFARIL